MERLGQALWISLMMEGCKEKGTERKEESNKEEKVEVTQGASQEMTHHPKCLCAESHWKMTLQILISHFKTSDLFDNSQIVWQYLKCALHETSTLLSILLYIQDI